MIFLLWNTAGSTTGFRPCRLQVREKFLYPYFSNIILRCTHVFQYEHIAEFVGRPELGNPRPFQDIGSGLLVLDSGFFVSGTWILHFNHWWDSGFQSPRFWIPQEFFSWIPNSTSKNFPDSRIRLDSLTLLLRQYMRKPLQLGGRNFQPWHAFQGTCARGFKQVCVLSVPYICALAHENLGFSLLHLSFSGPGRGKISV